MRLRLALRFGLLSAALFAAGCDEDSGTLFRPEKPGDPAAIQVRAAVSADRFHAGDPIDIEVAMVNPTDRKIVLTFSSGCILVFSVEDGSGAEVAPPPYACTMDVPVVEVPAHGEVAVHFTWDGAARAFHTYLPPGEYFVIGALGADQNKTAEPIPVEILAP